METKELNKKNTRIFTIIACIGLLFSGIFIIRAVNEGKLYEILYGNKQVASSTPIGQKIVSIKSAFQADAAIKEGDYEKALQLISGTTSEDYYNRGTIQTLLAYKNALQSSISGLESAQIFVAQAQQSFDIAKKLSTSRMMDEAIAENQMTIESLDSVVDIKTCYGIGQTIISDMNDISVLIQDIKDILAEEEGYIAKRQNALDKDCYEKLSFIADASREQVGMLGLQMQGNIQTYKAEFSDKIENPLICIQDPYENITPSIIKGKQGLSKYQELHTNTVLALKNNDQQMIHELCNQTKNDAQINQDIENSVQELLQKLDENTTASKEQQRASQQPQYKDFFSEDEQKVLKEIQEINRGRIDTILNIRGKGNYEPERYINDMFNQFYGNSGDFIDLHK